MEFNVAQLLKQPIGATREYELCDDLAGLEPEIVPVEALQGKLKLLRTNSGILAIGRLHTTLEITCTRCLEPVNVPVDMHFEESFRPLTDVETGRFLMPQEFQGQAEELVDEALIIDDHHILDLSEVVRQNIWLAMPMYPSCAWSDPQQCPNFAQRLQEMAEVHSDWDTEPAGETESVDPRWAALLALKEDRKNDAS